MPLAADLANDRLAAVDAHAHAGPVRMLVGQPGEVMPELVDEDVGRPERVGDEGGQERSAHGRENRHFSLCDVRVVRQHEDQSPWEIARFLELKTIWHPIGA